MLQAKGNDGRAMEYYRAVSMKIGPLFLRIRLKYSMIGVSKYLQTHEFKSTRGPG
jgi:hypothetical protein